MDIILVAVLVQNATIQDVLFVVPHTLANNFTMIINYLKAVV